MRIIQANTSVTYEEFYSSYYEKVLKYLKGKCARAEDAEDLTSQVFLYCYQNFSSYDPSKASLSSWVYMIANSRFKNYCRDRKLYVDIDEISEFIPDDSSPVDSAMMIDDMRDAIARALLKLSETDRMIVVLSYFKDMSSAEIGEQLDMSPLNVRVRLHRALKKMESELAEFR